MISWFQFKFKPLLSNATCTAAACKSPKLVTLLADAMEESKSAAVRGRIMEYVSRVLGDWPTGVLKHCQGGAVHLANHVPCKNPIVNRSTS